jgi:hypothetical protein
VGIIIKKQLIEGFFTITSIIKTPDKLALYYALNVKFKVTLCPVNASKQSASQPSYQK